MFDERVYKRGALALHALRRRIGDERFFALLRDWTARHRHATVTTAQFVELAARARRHGPLGVLHRVAAPARPPRPRRRRPLNSRRVTHRPLHPAASFPSCSVGLRTSRRCGRPPAAPRPAAGSGPAGTPGPARDVTALRPRRFGPGVGSRYGSWIHIHEVAGASGMSDLRRDVTALPDLLHGRARAGPVRERRPVYVDLLPPCNAGCPAGENIQAWLRTGHGGPPRRGVAHARCRQPAAGDPWSCLLPPVRERLQPRRTSTPRSRSTRSSGSSATSRWSSGWEFDPPPGRSGKRVLVVGVGAQRAVGRLPPRPARPRGRDPGRGRRARRDDALRHPGLSTAARRPRRRAGPDRGAGRKDHLRPPRRRPRRRAATREASTRSSSPSARICPNASRSPPATPDGSSTRCRSCAASPRASGR